MANNMIENKNFVIKKSTIPGAGKGLFTKIDITNGTVIMDYTGELIRPQKDWTGWDFHRAFDLEDNPFAEAAGFVLVQAGKDDLASYINHRPKTKLAVALPKEEQPNCAFVHNFRAPFVSVITTRFIEAGEELFISYGRGHTLRFSNNGKSKN